MSVIMSLFKMIVKKAANTSYTASANRFQSNHSFYEQYKIAMVQHPEPKRREKLNSFTIPDLLMPTTSQTIFE